MKTILDEIPADKYDKIEVVQINVGSDCCAAAARELKVTFNLILIFLSIQRETVFLFILIIL